VRAAVLVVLACALVAAIVVVATNGHVIFLPLILVPFVFLWPLGRRRS
jgi:hypothetical protein